QRLAEIGIDKHARFFSSFPSSKRPGAQMKNPSRPRLGGVFHAPSQKTSDAEIPPRMDCRLQIAISDRHGQLAIDLKRFHNTSPNGPRVYHMICADVTRK